MNVRLIENFEIQSVLESVGVCVDRSSDFSIIFTKKKKKKLMQNEDGW